MAKRLIATIGTFDGVHRGHRALLDELQALSTADQSLTPAVITFSPSPIRVLRPMVQYQQICTVDERLELLQEAGIPYRIVLPFDRAIAELSSEQFMCLLRDKYGVQELLLGYDHRFGHGAPSDHSYYIELGDRLGIKVHRSTPLLYDGAPISSSRIRSWLTEGDMQRANEALGYTYTLTGRVVGGLHIGRTMGYPTANIQLEDPDKLVPADGVYAVRVRTAQAQHYGMLYIGNRPTVQAGLTRTIEVNIFDLSADLYTQRLEVELTHYVRADQRFATLDALQAQIAQDEHNIRTYFNLPLH